jgi:transposase-like protein
LCPEAIAAVDKADQAIDFLLEEQRGEPLDARLLTKACRYHGVPETMTIDDARANAAAMEGGNATYGVTIATGEPMKERR